MANKLTIKIDYLKARLKRRRERIARYIELKRLSRIRKYSIPKYVHCKNCGETLKGMYCHKCGQYALDVNQSFWKYINNFLENAYQLDGRVLQTLRFLFTRPGFLSNEYVLGRVNSYVHPLKLYMFVSIVFFSFVLTIYSGESYSDKVAVAIADTNSKADTTLVVNKDSLMKQALLIRQEVLKSNGNDSILSAALNKGPSELSNTIIEGSSKLSAAINNGSSETISKKDKVKDYYKKTFEAISKYTPFLILLLMPFYAFILYRSNRKYHKIYLHSFVFSIHIHTLFLILVTLIALLYPYLGPWMVKVLLPIFVIYNIVATKAFYKRGWVVTILKSLFNLLIYSLVLLICLGVLSILVLVYVSYDLWH